MLLQILVAFSILYNCQAYNENSPNYKWSPNYFGTAIRAARPIIYTTPRRVSEFYFSTHVKTNFSTTNVSHTDLKALAVGKKVPAMRLYLPSNLPISGLEFIEKQIF